MKRAVESPAGPQEKPSDFRTTFCSLRRLPAQTRVMGRVMGENWRGSRRSERARVMGFATSLYSFTGVGGIFKSRFKRGVEGESS